MKVTIVAGARPNFMKIAPIIDEIKNRNSDNIQYRLVHTGQHYDKKMSGDFFEQLGIPSPDINLESGGGSQANQTANIMIKFEQELIQNPTDLVIVVGDVTSTMACSITAQKLHIKVAHIEGGIRSGDWSMPEEINRMVTDSISNYFFTTSETANKNLLKLGIEDDRIFFVGNTMIDTLLKHLPNFKKPTIWNELNLIPNNYFVITLHRPGNVDEGNKLKSIISTIVEHSHGLPIIFPVHPRTSLMLKKIGINYDNLFFIEPLSYLEFNYLVKFSKAVITDSGGITEEATVLSIPCMTLRENTERPETCEIGTNVLLGADTQAIINAFDVLFAGKWKKGGIPELWDGHTSERIIDQLIKIFRTNA